MCAQKTSSTDDENTNICGENEDVSEVDSEQTISGSQKERILKERGREVCLSMKGTLAILTAKVQMTVVLMMSLRMN